MDWTLFWQIAIPVTATIFISALLYYLSHREKVEIKHANMSAQLLGENETTTGIRIQYSFSLLYTKGTRSRYISETRLKFDKKLWENLRPYFHIPLEIDEPPDLLELTRLEIGKPMPLGGGWEFAARKDKIISQEERKELECVTQKLWYRYKIGWKDTYGKSRWKTINQLRERKKEKVM